MVGYAICEVLNKSFYAIQDGRTPMMTSIFGVLVNLGSAALLIQVFHMGVGGLALASAISSASIAAALLVMMNRRRRGVFSLPFFWNLVKTLLAGAAAFAAAKLIYLPVSGLWGGGMLWTLVKLCIAAAPAAAVFLLAAYLLRVNEMRTAIEKLLERKGQK